MVPKKAKEFIPLVSEQLGLDKELIDAVVSVYWKEIRLALTELKGNRVNVQNFGIFVSRKKKLLDLEYKYSNFVKERPGVTTFRRYAVIMDAQSRLEKIKNLLADLEKQELKKVTVKNKKDVYKTKSNLEESKGDTTGD